MFEGWLDGKVAVVTGAGRGIGRAIATSFAAAGADVAVAARSPDELEAVAGEVRSLGPRALVVPTDVSVEAEVHALIGRTVAELGTIDVLVNNAGAAPFLATFLETRPDGFAKYFDVNFRSVEYGMRAAGPILLGKGSGTVVNIASIDGFMVEPLIAYYNAAKAAVISLTKSVALEWAPHGVRVNAIAPGWIDTPMNQAERDDPQAERAIVSQVPLGRWGRPQEIANVALFLASEASSFMTGSIVVADGGQTVTSSREA
jgi:NAD(P)-dependent dehydrogenase (short-subunit alcohol dehydrogenase family)